ncbi:hypothetical protein E1B28_008627 [Marasmius oreades]|uniref:Uncharacterized protein n=1 Tax=Marasmius oreades TaxID=181124 RepID=A0A9P7S0D4_9AGAR|nr:uncharacterized protein E1B28_008627 [Marasmius oreades]KAG7092263.1 hypothetical protein E1B28_008627 [Marasmius oreades]
MRTPRKLLGLTLSRTRGPFSTEPLLNLVLKQSLEYLAIEALLELFASLLSEKGHPEFLNNVFDAELFPAHKTLRSIVGTAGKVDWEQISCQICQVLADMNIAYPQPFRIIKSSITGKIPSPVGQLYVDEKGFTSNIDEDDAYETFQVPYLIIDKIRFYSYEHSPTCTTFTFKLKSTPNFGRRGANENGEVTWTIDIERHRLQAFLKALKARNLVHLIDRHERKLSKNGDELSLELLPSSGTLSVSSMLLTTETAFNLSSQEKIQQFCDFPSESVLPTSPIVVLEDSTQVDGCPRAKIAPSSPKVALSTPPDILQGHSEQLDTMLDSELHGQRSSEQGIDGVRGLKRVAAQLSNSPPSKRKRLKASEGLNQRPQPSRGKPADEDLNNIAPPVFVKSPKATKRYGKKTRTSSPEAPFDGKSDYEQIPALQVAFKTSKKTQAGERKLMGAAVHRKRGNNGLASSPQREMKKEKQNGPGKRQRNGARGNAEAVDIHEYQPRRSARVKEQGNLKVIFILPQLKTVPECHFSLFIQIDYGDLSDEAQGRVTSAHYKEKERSDTSEKRSGQVSRKERKLETIELTLCDHGDSPQLQSDNPRPPRPEDILKQDGKSRRNAEVIDVDAEEDATVVHDDLQQQFPWSPNRLQQALKSPIPDLPKATSSKGGAVSAVKSTEIQQKKLLNDPGPYKAQTIIAKVSLKSGHVPPSKLAGFTSKTVRRVMNKTVPTNKSVASSAAPTLSPEPVNEDAIEDFSSPRPPERGNSPMVNQNNVDPAYVPRPAKTELSEMPSPRPPLAEHAQPTPSLVKYTPDLKSLPEAATSAKSKETSTVLCLSGCHASAADNELDVATLDKKSTSDNTPVLSKSFRRLEVTSMVEHGLPPLESSVKARPVQVSGFTSTPVTNGSKSAVRRRDSGLRRIPERNGYGLDLGPHHRKKERTADIVDVLNSIQQVLINKFTKRILEVKTEVRVGRDNILRDAAADIESMRIESASSFNEFLDLDSEYSSYSQDVLERLEDVNGVNITIVRKLEEILEHHDRNTLSKRFPKTLLSLPNTLTNPQL